MTFDELHDEYVKLTKEILEYTQEEYVDDEGNSRELYVYELNLHRLKTRYEVIARLLSHLGDVCDEHHEELLDAIFPVKE